MSAPPVGLEPHDGCDGYGCGDCNDGMVKYKRPARWLELLAVIVARADAVGCWMPGRDGYYAKVSGKLRRVMASGSGDSSSLRSLLRRRLTVRSTMWPDDRHCYEPTEEGREALREGMAKFWRGADS